MPKHFQPTAVEPNSLQRNISKAAMVKVQANHKYLAITAARKQKPVSNIFSPTNALPEMVNKRQQCDAHAYKVKLHVLLLPFV